MKRYRIEFEINVTEKASYEQVEEWIRYIIGDKGIMLDNPLSGSDFDPVYGTFKLTELP